MKKQLLKLFLLITAFGFSQADSLIIQSYINKNVKNLGLSSAESNQWVIQSATSSESMGLVNYLLMQTHNQIKIDNPTIYFWIKKGEVINQPEGFINNVSSKVNTTNPSLDVVAALSKVLVKLGENNFFPTVISSDRNKFKLSNGILADDNVTAELVYFLNEDKNLILSWSFEFYSQDTKHLWKIKADAITGKILEQFDLVHNCFFGPKHNHTECVSNQTTINFSNLIFKAENTTALMTPGTTAYRVIPFNYESPNHIDRQLVTNPEAAVASPFGWHNTATETTNGTQYSYTRGNNVFAYSDYEGTNPTNPTTYATPSSGTFPNLVFDHPYGGTGVRPTAYIKAATTNLFYMNNVMHDLWYQYGFNEVNRNFQQVNYGRGGRQGDFVMAEAQDASQSTTNPGINNANFSTPSDGNKPRMQMYLWDVGPRPKLLTINSPATIAGEYDAANNVFEPGNVVIPASPGISQDLVLFNDGIGDTSDGCSVAVNSAALNGKIAVIRRGDCTFAIKVKAAQNAGAIAVIIVNNDTANPNQLINMSGDDATITIPAISVTYNTGEAIIGAMANETVNIKIKNDPTGFVNSDGDFDNGIIAHEYTHGISTRLVGGGQGMSGSAEQPGEGWSDWAALMMQIKPGDSRDAARGIGTFAVNQPTTGRGIRQYLYSTDMTVNPHTFGDTNTMFYTDDLGSNRVDVHGLGSIWCAMLWDLAWNYIEVPTYGYNSDIYYGTGGNNKVMQLVIDAMKLTPANPTLVQCRDAILQADLQTTGGVNYCLIWETFARRGLGVNASSGSRTNIQDQVEDFTSPVPGNTPATGSNCRLASNSFEGVNFIKIFPNPTKGVVNISIPNYSGNLNVTVFDVNGRSVFSNNTDFSSERSLDLQGLQSGFYIIKLNGENGLSHSEKIILQ